jgi:hypothetical protein
MINTIHLIISLMTLKKNAQLYQIYFLDLMKQQMSVLIVKIYIIYKEKIAQYAIITEYSIALFSLWKKLKI